MCVCVFFFFCFLVNEYPLFINVSEQAQLWVDRNTAWKALVIGDVHSCAEKEAVCFTVSQE